MSEYQYVAFRAIDTPVSEANLRYMRKQSSRAEITPWSFDNEYHYGDFSGNAVEMLHRGYDIHLHYCNFGVMTLMLHLPQGFPHPAAVRPYLAKGGIKYRKDKTGQGGILIVSPYYEPFDSYFDQPFDEVLERLAPLRGEIMEGDLRPLYLANLAARMDDDHDPADEVEAPVPAGLEQPTAAQRQLGELYGIDKETIAAAAATSPPMAPASQGMTRGEWLSRQPSAKKDQWLTQCWEGKAGEVRRELDVAYRHNVPPASWPTNPGTRTIAQIVDDASALREKTDRKRAAAAEARRMKEQVAMANDPAKIMAKVDKLVAQQSTTAYAEASELLHRLGESLRELGKYHLAEEHAHRLQQKYPTRTRLVSELRKQGFLKKPSKKSGRA